MTTTSSHSTLQQTQEVLEALEYGKRKEEKELVDEVLKSLRLPRSTPKALAAAIVGGPGFEAFLIEVLKAVRPFALMMRAVYSFLNARSATTRTRTSVFRISSARAK